MKRGRKSRAELAALAQRPADLRAPWQIEQGARCGCRGADDLCPCQNENSWPRPCVDWKARAESAESALAASKAREEAAEARARELEAERGALMDALDPFAHLANTMAEFHEEQVVRVVYDDPSWGDNTVLGEFFVRPFRRARSLLSTSKTGA